MFQGGDIQEATQSSLINTIFTWLDAAPQIVTHLGGLQLIVGITA